MLVGWFFVALRPKSTAMVIAGRSVHLTTLFPGRKPNVKTSYQKGHFNILKHKDML